MFISTFLLIANLAALILNGVPLFSFWWLVLTYSIEITIEVIIYLFALVPILLAKSALEALK